MLTNYFYLLKIQLHFFLTWLLVISYLHGGYFLWVEAITHQHAERVSHSPQHSYSLRVRHSQQAVVVHLQDAHADLQSAIPCCCTD